MIQQWLFMDILFKCNFRRTTAFVSPDHPVRPALDRFLEHLQALFRSMVPPLGMFHFRPLAFILFIQVLSYVLSSLLNLMLRQK